MERGSEGRRVQGPEQVHRGCHPVIPWGSAPMPTRATAQGPLLPSWHQNLAAAEPRPQPRTPRAAAGPGPAGRASRPCLPPRLPAGNPSPRRPGFIAQPASGLSRGAVGQQMHLAPETQPPLSIVLHSHARSPTSPGGHFLEGSREADSPLSPLRSTPASPSPRTKQRPHLGLRPPLDWLRPGAGGPGHMGVLQLMDPTQGLGPQSPHLSIPPQNTTHKSGVTVGQPSCDGGDIRGLGNPSL